MAIPHLLFKVSLYSMDTNRTCWVFLAACAQKKYKLEEPIEFSNQAQMLNASGNKLSEGSLIILYTLIPKSTLISTTHCFQGKRDFRI